MHAVHSDPYPEGDILSRIVLVTGPAGYGKTHWLLDQVGAHMGSLSGDHQRLLAVSRMHGGRRRLDATLALQYPVLLRTVTTLDSFALGLVNRWRRSFDVSRPFVIGTGLHGGLFGTDTHFEEVLERGVELMRSHTVRKFVSSTYPLVIIDEFQDCHGRILELAKMLCAGSTVLLAADDFQLLDTDISGCPAVEWVRRSESEGAAEIIELTSCHRTDEDRLLNATRALRENRAVDGASIEVYSCPSAPTAASVIIRKLVLCPRETRWVGPCALLSPTMNDPWIFQVLDSCASQLKKKGLHPVTWAAETSESEAAKRLLEALGVGDETAAHEEWPGPSVTGKRLVRETQERVDRFMRARGLRSISRGAVAHLAHTLLHTVRTRGHSSPKRIVATIHGAKNREFDHVFILWPYKVRSEREQVRRLLYNAISRAKKTAVLLVRDPGSRASDDPVISLLGPSKPAVRKKKR